MKKPRTTGGGRGFFGFRWGNLVGEGRPTTKDSMTPVCSYCNAWRLSPRGVLSPHSCHASPFFWLLRFARRRSGERLEEARHFGRAFFLSEQIISSFLYQLSRLGEL